MSERIEQVLAAVSLLWIIGCWVAFGFALAAGQFFLAFSLAVASLALPFLIEAIGPGQP